MQIRSWLAAIGFSLCFGTINTKMWRVYYIFNNPKPASKKKVHIHKQSSGVLLYVYNVHVCKMLIICIMFNLTVHIFFALLNSH